MKRKKIINVGLLAMWMVFIFYMSNQPAEISSAQSDFVLKLVEKSGITIDAIYIDVATTIIRKGAHITEYAILGILFYNVLILFYKKRQAILFGVILTIGYAITDEIHQLFVSGRAGRVIDVCIDSIGAIIGIILVVYWKKFRGKEKKKIT